MLQCAVVVGAMMPNATDYRRYLGSSLVQR